MEKICKVYVTMILQVAADGSIHPKGMIWEDGHLYKIDRVKSVSPVISKKTCSCGMRYTVMIDGQERYFYDDKGRWFTEVPVYAD